MEGGLEHSIGGFFHVFARQTACPHTAYNQPTTYPQACYPQAYLLRLAEGLSLGGPPHSLLLTY